MNYFQGPTYVNSLLSTTEPLRLALNFNACKVFMLTLGRKWHFKIVCSSSTNYISQVGLFLIECTMIHSVSQQPDRSHSVPIMFIPASKISFCFTNYKDLPTYSRDARGLKFCGVKICVNRINGLHKTSGERFEVYNILQEKIKTSNTACENYAELSLIQIFLNSKRWARKFTELCWTKHLLQTQ